MLREWFIRNHGLGEPHQSDLYRCLDCRAIITWKKIRAGQSCCGGRMSPTNPTFFEKVKLLVFPWFV